MSHCTYFEKNITYGGLKMPCVGIFVVHFIFILNALCIETKRNCVNHNKGEVTLKIFPWDSMSLAMSWRSGSFKKVKIPLGTRSLSIRWWLKRYREKLSCHRQNMMGRVTPPTSWKVGVVLFRIINLKAELKKPFNFCKTKWLLCIVC